ncbi:MAG: ATP-binding domain-containing protein [Bilophila wadsworthia]
MRQLQEDRTALNTLLEKNRQTDYPLLLDYGYALSVHKAQGSEWERVLLIDERNRYMSDDDYTRWLYTGVTRTKERLLIVS